MLFHTTLSRPIDDDDDDDGVNERNARARAAVSLSRSLLFPERVASRRVVTNRSVDRSIESALRQ